MATAARASTAMRRAVSRASVSSALSSSASIFLRSISAIRPATPFSTASARGMGGGAVGSAAGAGGGGFVGSFRAMTQS